MKQDIKICTKCKVINALLNLRPLWAIENLTRKKTQYR